MTSNPASRNAAAITLAPRSWPSSPGLATSTRIFLWLSFIGGKLPAPPTGRHRGVGPSGGMSLAGRGPAIILHSGAPTKHGPTDRPGPLGPGGEQGVGVTCSGTSWRAPRAATAASFPVVLALLLLAPSAGAQTLRGRVVQAVT